MSSAFSVELPRDVVEMLEPGEEVLWSGKPVKTPFVVKGLVVNIFTIPFILFPVFIFMNVPKLLLEPMVLAFFALWWGMLGLISFGNPIYSFFVWKNIFYIITNKRIIVRKGLIGIDYDVLDLDHVQQVNVDVGFWDKIYETGTLTVQAIGVKPIILYCVENPQKVQAILRKAVEFRRRGTSI